MQLQKECSNTVRHYMQILSEGCDLLAEVKEGVLTKETREKIFSHRKKELLAHYAYDRAQRQLWRFLSDADEPAPISRLTASPEPKRNSKQREDEERQPDARQAS